MSISDAQFFLVDELKLKAYVTHVFDNCFVVRDLWIIQSSTGLFVAMPSKKRKKGLYKDIFHPLNQETRHSLERKILELYATKMKVEYLEVANPSQRVE